MSSTAPLTMHPSHTHSLSHQQDANTNYYAQLVEVEADIADDATVCCPNLASAASDNSTQAIVKEEWTNSDDKNGDSQCTNIDNIDGVDAASFQYNKRGTCGTSASAAQFLQQQQTAPTRTKT
jgi:hypothetical protein